MTTGKGINQALVAIKAIVASAGGITKDRNAPMGYKFRGVEDFDDVLCGIFAQHGVNMFPRLLSKEIIHGITQKGQYQCHVFLEYEWKFVCAADDSFELASVMGEAMDTQDKASNKAVQASRKYAILSVLQIPTSGDNTEQYQHEPAQPQQQPPPHVYQAPPAQQQPPAGDPMAAQIANGQLAPPAQKRTRGPNVAKPPAAPPPPAQHTPAQPTPPGYPLTPARTVEHMPPSLTDQQIQEAVAAKAAANAPRLQDPNHGQVAADRGVAAVTYAPDEQPFPAGAPTTAKPAETLLGRIGDINSFPVLYAMAQECEAVTDPQPRAELYTAIQNRGVYLFASAKNHDDVKSGFPLVNALGQPELLKRAANDAHMRFRQ